MTRAFPKKSHNHWAFGGVLNQVTVSPEPELDLSYFRAGKIVLAERGNYAITRWQLQERGDVLAVELELEPVNFGPADWSMPPFSSPPGPMILILGKVAWRIDSYDYDFPRQVITIEMTRWPFADPRPVSPSPWEKFLGDFQERLRRSA